MVECSSRGTEVIYRNNSVGSEFGRDFKEEDKLKLCGMITSVVTNSDHSDEWLN